MLRKPWSARLLSEGIGAPAERPDMEKRSLVRPGTASFQAIAGRYATHLCLAPVACTKCNDQLQGGLADAHRCACRGGKRRPAGHGRDGDLEGRFQQQVIFSF